MPEIDRYLRLMSEKGASDLHLLAGAHPKLRIRGELQAISDEPILDKKSVYDLLAGILSSRQKETYAQKKDLDFAYTIEGVARFRCNYFVQKRGYGAVFRIIPEKIKSISDLNLPPVLEKLATLKKGLVLVTGPTGSGKSTTLAAIIDQINSTQNKHILTIEDPIEFVHENKNCIVRQREVGADTMSFANALRASLREDIDVVLVGEMRDLETISLAVTLAETGALVFATLHTSSAGKTIDRIVDVFPQEQQEQIRVMLGDSLKAVVAQQLLPTKDGNGRVAALEILMGSPAVGNVIREAKTQQIISIIQSGGGEGMQTLDSHLMALIRDGVIGAEEAYMRALDKKAFENLMLEALIEAASTGEDVRILSMIKEGASINSRDANNATPLILSASSGHPEVVRLLIFNGADLDAQDNSGMTALMRAVQAEHFDILKMLIGEGADVNLMNKGGYSALMLAASSGNAEMVQALIAAKAEVNVIDKLGASILVRATIAGHFPVVDMLICAGANLEIQDKSGRTAFLYALEKAQKPIVRSVLGAGANVNITNQQGITALILAAGSDPGIVPQLIEKGADVNAVSQDGTTALIQASRRGNTDAARALIEAGADVNARTEEGMTPLMYAARSFPEVAELLVRSGADVTAKSGSGQTARKFAEQAGHQDIVQLLSA